MISLINAEYVGPRIMTTALCIDLMILPAKTQYWTMWKIRHFQIIGTLYLRYLESGELLDFFVFVFLYVMQTLNNSLLVNMNDNLYIRGTQKWNFSKLMCIKLLKCIDIRGIVSQKLSAINAWNLASAFALWFSLIWLWMYCIVWVSKFRWAFLQTLLTQGTGQCVVCVYWHCSLSFYWFSVRNSSLCSFHCINIHCCNFVLNLILKSVMFGTTVCEMCWQFTLYRSEFKLNVKKISESGVLWLSQSGVLWLSRWKRCILTETTRHHEKLFQVFWALVHTSA